MIFKNPGSYYSGQTVSTSALEKVNFDGNENIIYETSCTFSIVDGKNDEIIKVEKLQANWLLLIFYNGNEIFKFDTMEKLNITDKEVPPTNDQLKDLVKITYSYLQKAFDQRREEFKMFDSLVNIHCDTIDEYQNQLRHIFPVLQS